MYLVQQQQCPCSHSSSVPVGPVRPRRGHRGYIPSCPTWGGATPPHGRAGQALPWGLEGGSPHGWGRHHPGSISGLPCGYCLTSWLWLGCAGFSSITAAAGASQLLEEHHCCCRSITAAAAASLLLLEHGVMSAAKTSVVSAAKTSALSAAKTSALSAAKASALKTSASSHISMIKTTTCARLRRADVVVGGIEM